MREFPSGATRDDVEGKLSYFKALSPEVLRRYVEYLAKHRKQADGQMRDWDNWKAGIPQAEYMDSLLRHAVDAWLTALGYKTYEETSFEDLLCAIIFNAMGCLYERIKKEDSILSPLPNEICCDVPIPRVVQVEPITDPHRMLGEAKCSTHYAAWGNGCMPVGDTAIDTRCFVPKEPAE